MTRTVLAAFALGVLLGAGTAKAGAAPDALCQETKAKAAGKKAFDLMKAFGKNLKKPDANKLSAGISKAQSKFTKGFDKAEAREDCATSGDSDAIEAKVDALVIDVLANVDVACGDNIRAGDEQCDGTDDSACPGRCIAAGAGGGTCGDNTINGGDECTCVVEQCDRTDDALCPGVCQANCRCPQPVCGNGVLEAGEECEPPCSEDPPCGSGTICGVSCECEPAAPCDCGTPDPPTTLAFESEMQGGICGVLKDGNDITLLDLECADSYVGCGVAGSAPVATPIPIGTSLYKVECCYGTKLALRSYGPADTGSIRNCTEAGCLMGAPIPVLTNPLILSPCTWDLVRTDAFGSADCSTGEVAIDVGIEAPVFLTGDQLPKRCSGGSDPGGKCAEDSDCPGGGTCLADPTYQPCPICNPTTLTCNGGPNNGLACTPGTPEISPQYPTSHDCPPHWILEVGVQLQHWSLRTGTASTHAADGEFCGYCRDTDVGGSSCYDGDPDTDLTPGQKRCPDSAVIPDCQPASYHAGQGGSIDGCGPLQALSCASDADCYAPYETCEQRVPGAFDYGEAQTIANWGAPAGDLSDRLGHSVTLTSLHCAPVSFSEQVDQNACFPGPAATSLPGTLQLLP